MNNRARPVARPARIVVVGIGNLLLGDDGLGVHALWKLREMLPDPRLEYLDGGTVGLGLLPYLEDATHVLFLDAIDAPQGLRAGEGLIELPLEDAPADLGLRVSPHDAGLPELVGTLRLRRGSRPLTMRLLGAPPAELGVSTELSEEAERALVRVVGQAITLLRGWLNQDLGKAA
jgi:hydrogenase maturation protease